MNPVVYIKIVHNYQSYVDFITECTSKSWFFKYFGKITFLRTHIRSGTK